MNFKKVLFLLLLVFVTPSSFCGDVPVGSKAAAAPVRKCEIYLSTWCILDGAFEINRRLSDVAGYDRVWRLRGWESEASRIVILEPNGCRAGASDTVSLLALDKNILFENENWNRLEIQTKKDGSCNLAIYALPAGEITKDWAYSMGMGLIRNCRDYECREPSFRDLIIKQIIQNKMLLN